MGEKYFDESRDLLSSRRRL